MGMDFSQVSLFTSNFVCSYLFLFKFWKIILNYYKWYLDPDLVLVCSGGVGRVRSIFCRDDSSGRFTVRLYKFCWVSNQVGLGRVSLQYSETLYWLTTWPGRVELDSYEN